MARWFLRSLAALLFCFAVGAVTASAQTAKISGRVADAEGLPVPGAKVQLIHKPDQATQALTTDNTGAYTVAHLAAGEYQVIVEAPGFGRNESATLVLVEGQALVFDVKVAVANVTEQVNVSTSTSSVTLDSATLSGTLSKEEVTGYGLNGRNFSQLITLTPGVSNQSGQDEAKVGVTGSAKFSVNGGRVEYNTFEVDGSDVLNTSINASRGQGLPLVVYPSVDAIQELQVLTSNYGAQYGKSASGSVLVTTKSGGSQFHGNVYGFIRNELFNARNYFDQPVASTPVSSTGGNVTGRSKYKTPLYRRQDYGGTFGGPVYIPGHFTKLRDKTFFFFSEELRLEKTPVDYNQAVPTLAERSGDFSDVCPFIGTSGGSATPSTVGYPDCPVPTGGTPGGGSIIGEHVNVSYLSNAVLNTNIIPLPNSPNGCNTTNKSGLNTCYVASVSPSTYWREELFRIDHNLTPTELLSFRYIHDSWHTTTLTPQYGVVQNSFPTVENYLTGPGLDMVLGLAQTLPHGFLNQVRLSFTVEHIGLTGVAGPGVTSLARPTILDNASPGVTGGIATPNSAVCSIVTGPQPNPPGQVAPQQLTECPLGTIFHNGSGGKLPGLVFQGNNGAYGGHGFNVDTGFTPWTQSNPTYVLRDDVSKTIGRHTLQFGFSANYNQQNEQSAADGANSGDLQGLLTFSNQQSKYTTGNAFADFLAGPGLFQVTPNSVGTGTAVQNTDYSTTAIKSFTQDSGVKRYYNRYQAVDLYLQDDFHLNSRFTLNIGVRASLFGQWYNPNGTAYNWEPQAYNRSLGGSIFIDPNFGELVRTTGSGNSGGGSLPAVPLDPAHLDPTIVNGLVQCGANGVPDSCMSNHLFNPAPRIGFAWDPFGNGRTSIRAGYGLFWEHGTGGEANVGSLIGSPPLVLSETQSFPSPVNIGVPGTGIANSPGASPFSGAYNSIGLVCTANCTQTNGASVSSGTFPLNVTSIPTKAHYSYTQQWSLSVQRELRKSLVGTLAYVGAKGTHLTTVRDLNQLPSLPSGFNPFQPGEPLTSGICGAGATQGVFPTSGTTAGGITSSRGIGPNQPGYVNAFVACTGSAGFKNGGNILGVSADTLRPYTGFSNIISVENVADSSYHALQGTLKQTVGGATLGLTYTYSHSIDDASDRSSANFADSLNIHSNRSSSDFDQRQLINVSYIYNLPLLKLFTGFTSFIPDGSTGSDSNDPGAVPQQDSPLLRALLDGWQLSGITLFQTGTPFSVINAGSADGTAAADNAGVGNGLGIGSYADIAPGPIGTRPTVPSSGSNVGPLLGNPRGFVAPRGLTFGNSGRNYLHNPSRTNFNMALLKQFKVFGEKNAEFRIEAFNVFNHTQFRIYDPSHPGNTGNNVINCYGDVATGYSAGANSCLAGNSFLHPVDAHDPRILQLGLKVAF